MTDIYTGDMHVISTTESQVWLVPVDYNDEEHHSAEDAEELVRAQYSGDKPDYVYYEGLLSDEVENANRDGIALLRD